MTRGIIFRALNETLDATVCVASGIRYADKAKVPEPSVEDTRRNLILPDLVGSTHPHNHNSMNKIRCKYSTYPLILDTRARDQSNYFPVARVVKWNPNDICILVGGETLFGWTAIESGAQSIRSGGVYSSNEFSWWTSNLPEFDNRPQVLEYTYNMSMELLQDDSVCVATDSN